MNKTVGIIAHVDAGKTTFSESLLYHTNTINNLGRVDHKNSHLDTHEIEKKRGITIFSEQAVIDYKNDKYYLIDTPGHIDFSPEMERNLSVMDFAIIIISATEGIQGHTETVWQLLKKHNIPAFFFINKMDKEGADIDNVFNEIKTNLTKDTALIKGNLNNELNNNLIENIADLDYELLDMYLEDKYDKQIWINHMKILIKELMFYPCFSGSALKNIGIDDFFDNFHILTETNYNSEKKLKGKIYKIKYDGHGNRISFFKIISGSLKIKDEIFYNVNNKQFCEKINELRIYNGKEYVNKDYANAGSLVGIIGLSNTQIGMGIGNIENDKIYDMTPALKSKVLINKNINQIEVINAFKILNDEDPSLKMEWNKKLQELHIHVMGIIQLEVLKEVLEQRFNLKIGFDKPGILYKETVNNSVVGRGHFEPLKHYAEVHLKIEPLPRNSGIIFENLCNTDNLTKGNQNLIKQYILEKAHRGILTGSPLTDIKITLITGKSHNKHTSGGDFKEATYRAFRQGLEKADNILLEPSYEFKIKINSVHIGRVLSDIQKANGIFDPPKNIEDNVIITGTVPVASFINYPNEFLSFTSGKGIITLIFTGYNICHNQQKIIDTISYDKDNDPEYSSSSIFCSKGQGYTIPWFESDKKMHCK